MRERAVRLADALVEFEGGSAYGPGGGKGGARISNAELVKRIDDYHDGISACLGYLYSHTR